MMPILTGIDILGIQSYVFASNRLRDVLAASWLAEHVTSRPSLAQWGRSEVNVLLAAGGNAIVEFGALDDAKQWTASYSRWVQDTAPGLETAVVHREYDRGGLAWALKALAIDLARVKAARRPSTPQLGLSVIAACAITGLPATAIDRTQNVLVSPRVQKLRARVDSARERWHEYVPTPIAHAPSWEAEFPLELDLLGRTSGDTSLIGVVHVDGNGVGRAITEWLDRCIYEDVNDDDVRGQYREWSEDLDSLGKAVLHAVVKRVADRIIEDSSDAHGHPDPHCVARGTPHDLSFRLHQKRDDRTDRAAPGEQTVFLPLRPIVLGGDDLTFVCDGRIALDLAATALKHFEAGAVRHLGEGDGERRITACAGAALVRVHAPFYRGYQLAERLCRSAKYARRKHIEKDEGETGGWLDWHVGATRPSESVEEVRTRQYRAGAQQLTMRPYPLAQLNNRRQSWRWLDEDFLGPAPVRGADGTFRGFRREGGADEKGIVIPNAWSGSRSRVKLLGSLVASGPDEIRRQIDAWSALGEAIALPGGLPGNGYLGPTTPLRDAIELLDLHVRLDPDPYAPDPPAATSGSASASPDVDHNAAE